MDREVVIKWLNQYPKMENFIGAGTISLKMAREILDVDRYFMYDLFCKLVVAGAITPSGTNAFRATKEMQALLKERRAREKKGE